MSRLETIKAKYPGFCFECGDWVRASYPNGSTCAVHYCNGLLRKSGTASIHPVINDLISALVEAEPQS